MGRTSKDIEYIRLGTVSFQDDNAANSNGKKQDVNLLAYLNFRGRKELQLPKYGLAYVSAKIAYFRIKPNNCRIDPSTAAFQYSPLKTKNVLHDDEAVVDNNKSKGYGAKVSGGASAGFSAFGIKLPSVNALFKGRMNVERKTHEANKHKQKSSWENRESLIKFQGEDSDGFLTWDIEDIEGKDLVGRIIGDDIKTTPEKEYLCILRHKKNDDWTIDCQIHIGEYSFDLVHSDSAQKRKKQEKRYQELDSKRKLCLNTLLGKKLMHEPIATYDPKDW